MQMKVCGSVVSVKFVKLQIYCIAGIFGGGKVFVDARICSDLW